MNKITLGTIARTIAVILVIVNAILKATGHSVIDFDEGTIMYYLEYILEIAIIVVGFWKNNSFSSAAIAADEYLHSLKESKESEDE